MKKLTLNLDELRVEAFATVAPALVDEGALENIATLICSEKRSCGHVCP
ncbi:MAG TPA: hypothetical protein VFS20_05020 [Longimicrobium sp.]|nr:hypothetical protein [Longimicrobium sp.]